MYKRAVLEVVEKVVIPLFALNKVIQRSWARSKSPKKEKCRKVENEEPEEHQVPVVLIDTCIVRVVNWAH